jgi:uncharacterized protein YdeI (YjbR/CyaY-like superfamily)
VSTRADQDLPVISFESAGAWDDWLAENHESSSGISMRIFKVAARTQSITYREALEIALCYGWIDGFKKKYDERSWLQKFTPRSARGVWSKVNTQHAERLIAAGRMKPVGLAQVEAAKRDGRWDRAYAPPSAAEVPEDFLAELEKHPAAKAFFATLNKRNTFPIYYRLHSAKRPETRRRRMQEILAMMERGEKFYP